MLNPFTALKNKGLAVGIKAFINREIKDAGEVSDLDIDTDKRTMRVQLDLKGEATPIVIDVTSYEVSEKNDKLFLKVKKVKASREWITAILNKFAVNQSFEVPNTARLLF